MKVLNKAFLYGLLCIGLTSALLCAEGEVQTGAPKNGTLIVTTQLNPANLRQVIEALTAAEAMKNISNGFSSSYPTYGAGTLPKKKYKVEVTYTSQTVPLQVGTITEDKVAGPEYQLPDFWTSLVSAIASPTPPSSLESSGVVSEEEEGNENEQSSLAVIPTVSSSSGVADKQDTQATGSHWAMRGLYAIGSGVKSAGSAVGRGASGAASVIRSASGRFGTSSTQTTGSGNQSVDTARMTGASNPSPIRPLKPQEIKDLLTRIVVPTQITKGATLPSDLASLIYDNLKGMYPLMDAVQPGYAPYLETDNLLMHFGDKNKAPDALRQLGCGVMYLMPREETLVFNMTTPLITKNTDLIQLYYYLLGSIKDKDILDGFLKALNNAYIVNPRSKDNVAHGAESCNKVAGKAILRQMIGERAHKAVQDSEGWFASLRGINKERVLLLEEYFYDIPLETTGDNSVTQEWLLEFLQAAEALEESRIPSLFEKAKMVATANAVMGVGLAAGGAYAYSQGYLDAPIEMIRNWVIGSTPAATSILKNAASAIPAAVPSVVTTAPTGMLSSSEPTWEGFFSAVGNDIKDVAVDALKGVGRHVGGMAKDAGSKFLGATKESAREAAYNTLGRIADALPSRQ